MHADRRYTASTAFSAAVLFAILDPLSTQTGLGLDQLNQGTGYQWLASSLSALILQPAALAFGKKPIYIFSSLASVPVLIWTLYTQGNSQWIANRIMVGLTGGIFFTLPDASIADLFFYHQRAWPIGVYIATTFVATILGPIMGGCVYQSYGWRPVIYIPAAIQGATTVFLFMFLEETNYDRDEAPIKTTVGAVPVDSPADSDAAELDDKDKAQETVVGVEQVAGPVHEYERMSTPWPGLTPLRFRKPSPYWPGIMFRGILQPFLMIPIPIVLWSGLMFGYYQCMFSGKSGSWKTRLTRTSHQLVVIWYSNSRTVQFRYEGSRPYIHLSADIDLPWVRTRAYFGDDAHRRSVLAGFVADKYTLRKAKANHGISEPEHKLDLFLISGSCTPIGLLMMGLGPYYGAHWIVYVIGAFILNIAGPLASTLSVAYIFDCFHSLKPTHNGVVQAKVQGCATYVVCNIFITMCFVFGFVSGYSSPCPLCRCLSSPLLTAYVLKEKPTN